MSQVRTIPCNDVYRFLIEELDDALDTSVRTAIKSHLQQCTNCSSVLASLKKTISLYKSMPDALVPTSLTEHILETIRNSAKK